MIRLAIYSVLILAGWSWAGVREGDFVVFPQMREVRDDFAFLINADAHANRQKPGLRNPRPHNVILREFVAAANALRPPPAFVIFNGDIFEREAVPESTNALIQTVKELNALPIAVTGNHDVRDFDVDHIFRPVQQAFNGTTNHTFSFNCGRWHFIILPTKELLVTPEDETALLDWLARDLEAHRTWPTMVFSHYHLLPVGTSQLEYYSQSLAFKNRLLDVLSRPGNVKYVFSGHVHAGIQNSIKTAWTWQGMHFIINPSGVRPRPFGEEYPEFSLEGGWFTRVKIRGATAHLFGCQSGRDVERAYPERFREFAPGLDARALTPVWELPAHATLKNGGFEDGLTGWLSPWRYQADREPGYVTEVTDTRRASGHRAVRVEVRDKGPHWALGEFTELYQVVRAPNGDAPRLRFRYFPESAQNGGGYTWVAGFQGDRVQFTALFQWGPKLQQRHTLTRVISFVISGGDYEGARLAALTRQGRTAFWKLPEAAGRWHTVDVNLAAALNEATGSHGLYRLLQVDRMVIALGAWCAADAGSRSTMWFDDLQ